MNKIAPLSGGFMAGSIIGLMVSGLYVFKYSKTWGFTLMLVFGIMFVSSLVSMTYGPTQAKLK